MVRISIAGIFLLVACLVVGSSVLWAAGGIAPTVAVAVTMGRVEVNQMSAEGSANVPEGAQLKTHDSAARLQFRAGGRATLGTDSQAKVYAGRLVLESGSGLVSGSTSLILEALGFKIQPVDAAGSALVERQNNRIVVSTVSGSAWVYDPNGKMAGVVHPGRAVSFEPTELAPVTAEAVTPQDDKDTGKKARDKKAAAIPAGDATAETAGKATGTAAEKAAGTTGAAKTAGAATAHAGLSPAAQVGVGLAVAAGVGLGIAVPLALLSR